MIPMEEVRLIWNSEVPLPEGIWLSRDWVPFSRNPHQLKFSFMCEQEDVCVKLKEEMQKVNIRMKYIKIALRHNRVIVRTDSDLSCFFSESW